MAVAAPPAPKKQQSSSSSRKDNKKWMNKLGYLGGAILLHVIAFVLLATYVIFPAFRPPDDSFTKTFIPPAPPPPPPPQTQPMEVPTATAAPPTTTITSPNATPSFTVPIPDLTPSATPVQTQQKPMDKIVTKPNTISPQRLADIKQTVEKYRDHNNVLNSAGDPHNVVTKFPVYLASYANGDWSYAHEVRGKAIYSGALPNLVAKINEWSHGNIKGEIVPDALDIGSPDLMDKRPPFIYFTGHKDFTLTDQEIQNLRDYLQAGGCIWGDNALAGRGSRFDVAFRREMKRVVPDIDKQFEPYAMEADVFTKSWYPLTKLATGMNYYSEPIEHLDIDGKLAVFYTPNDYTDMFSMRILPGDQKWKRGVEKKFRGKQLIPEVLDTPQHMLYNRNVFFRNYDLPPCLECQKLGMNIIGYLLVRFDKDLLLTP